ncbi:Hypothetical protein, putative [Bodo saltans]|uniref:Uncharacterized protein n=1 Tax=Bodo saltans TaxID=75058 RepID=A0A0S4J6J4_BODSA|nr:Hypothetical protein, putative [Bodo saltans]|eukprot:CUG71086.1 Hypothetical protein, putative [Bodo saltans]
MTQRVLVGEQTRRTQADEEMRAARVAADQKVAAMQHEIMTLLHGGAAPSVTIGSSPALASNSRTPQQNERVSSSARHHPHRLVPSTTPSSRLAMIPSSPLPPPPASPSSSRRPPSQSQQQRPIDSSLKLHYGPRAPVAPFLTTPKVGNSSCGGALRPLPASPASESLAQWLPHIQAPQSSSSPGGGVRTGGASSMCMGSSSPRGGGGGRQTATSAASHMHLHSKPPSRWAASSPAALRRRSDDDDERRLPSSPLPPPPASPSSSRRPPSQSQQQRPIDSSVKLHYGPRAPVAPFLATPKVGNGSSSGALRPLPASPASESLAQWLPHIQAPQPSSSPGGGARTGGVSSMRMGSSSPRGGGGGGRHTATSAASHTHMHSKPPSRWAASSPAALRRRSDDDDEDDNRQHHGFDEMGSATTERDIAQRRWLPQSFLSSNFQSIVKWAEMSFGEALVAQAAVDAASSGQHVGDRGAPLDAATRCDGGGGANAANNEEDEAWRRTYRMKDDAQPSSLLTTAYCAIIDELLWNLPGFQHVWEKMRGEIFSSIFRLKKKDLVGAGGPISGPSHKPEDPNTTVTPTTTTVAAPLSLDIATNEQLRLKWFSRVCGRRATWFDTASAHVIKSHELQQTLDNIHVSLEKYDLIFDIYDRTADRQITERVFRAWKTTTFRAREHNFSLQQVFARLHKRSPVLVAFHGWRRLIYQKKLRSSKDKDATVSAVNDARMKAKAEELDRLQRQLEQETLRLRNNAEREARKHAALVTNHAVEMRELQSCQEEKDAVIMSLEKIDYTTTLEGGTVRSNPLSPPPSQGLLGDRKASKPFTSFRRVPSSVGTTGGAAATTSPPLGVGALLSPPSRRGTTVSINESQPPTPPTASSVSPTPVLHSTASGIEFSKKRVGPDSTITMSIGGGGGGGTAMTAGATVRRAISPVRADLQNLPMHSLFRKLRRETRQKEEWLGLARLVSSVVLRYRVLDVDAPHKNRGASVIAPPADVEAATLPAPEVIRRSASITKPAPVVPQQQQVPRTAQPTTVPRSLPSSSGTASPGSAPLSRQASTRHHSRGGSMFFSPEAGGNSDDGTGSSPSAQQRRSIVKFE